LSRRLGGPQNHCGSFEVRYLAVAGTRTQDSGARSLRHFTLYSITVPFGGIGQEYKMAELSRRKELYTLTK